MKFDLTLQFLRIIIFKSVSKNNWYIHILENIKLGLEVSK